MTSTLKAIQDLGIVSILDWGNSYCKTIVNKGRTKVYPSCTHELSPAQLKRQRAADELSPLIAFDGRSYLIGQKAIEFSGSSNWSGNKLLPASLKLGIYSAHPESATINQLVLCVPDSSMDLDFSSLLGVHNYQFNGRTVKLDILDIETIDETYGVWLGARSMFRHPDRNNITVTIGAKTVNVDCRNGKGEVLYSLVNDRLGMASIATRLASDIKAMWKLDGTPSIESIMDCMARNELILPGTDINFRAQFEIEIARWKRSLSEFLHNSANSTITYWDYAIGGAGAGYLRSGGNAIVVPSPQTFAIESLIKLYEN